MKTLRAWATPLTIGTFIIMSVTGVLMFFHADSGLNKVAHEWVGLVMVAAVVAHLLLNWRAFTTYFKRPVAMTFMAVGALVLAASFAIDAGGAGGANGFRAAMGAMSNARIETLAELAGKDTETVLARLGAAGIDASATETLSALAGGDHGVEETIMGQIFAN